MELAETLYRKQITSTKDVQQDRAVGSDDSQNTRVDRLEDGKWILRICQTAVSLCETTDIATERSERAPAAEICLRENSAEVKIKSARSPSSWIVRTVGGYRRIQYMYSMFSTVSLPCLFCRCVMNLNKYTLVFYSVWPARELRRPPVMCNVYNVFYHIDSCLVKKYIAAYSISLVQLFLWRKHCIDPFRFWKWELSEMNLWVITYLWVFVPL